MVMWRAPWFLDHAELGHLKEAGPQATVVSGFRTALAALLVAAAGAVSLVFTSRTLRVAQDALEHNRQHDSRQEALAREAHLTDYLVKAVSLLAEGDLNLRLGGLYALERIMRDSVKDHDTVVQLLSAYIRAYSRQRPDDDEWRLRDDVQTALTILARRPPDPSERAEIDLSYTDLRGARLRNAHLPGAQFIKSNLDRADFDHVDLAGCDFTDATLVRADLVSSSLRDVRLQEADLQLANLKEADINGALLHRAKLACDDTNLATVTVQQLLTASVTHQTVLGSAHSQAEGMQAHINECTQAFIDGTTHVGE
ncbi:pentapeptide repeat protein [Streptomyces sp. TLI_146]|nr:pentapeptide repeat protein [Streptomyces sp. TLI_146]